MLDLMFGGRYLVFVSPLSLEEATTRLAREIAPPGESKEWRRALEFRAREDRPQSFIGTFADGRFHLVRLVRGRNIIRPWIDGTLSRAAPGCRVDVRLKLAPIAIAGFTPFVLMGLFLVSRAPFFLVPAVLMALVPYIPPMLEAQRALRLLGTVFEWEPSPIVDQGPRISV